ncbi:MAG: pilus biosynthesis protein TadE [Rubritepida sp.]|nr:pilus biosynthesis protein TadE [Rubritepida sp.]
MHRPVNPGGEDGSVAVEFALTATLLLTLIFAIMSFGIQFGARIIAAQAASEGARAAAGGLSATERQTLARAAATSTLNSYGGIASLRTIAVVPVGSPVTRLDVTVALDISAFGLSKLSGFVPSMPAPSARVSVQVGGY